MRLMLVPAASPARICIVGGNIEYLAKVRDHLSLVDAAGKRCRQLNINIGAFDPTSNTHVPWLHSCSLAHIPSAYTCAVMPWRPIPVPFYKLTEVDVQTGGRSQCCGSAKSAGTLTS
ncbi:hypothetical protein IF1G_00584 [Cordyceps javanica]|uniref:Uncharacterized protein n=1 Tax=Cordyceps javanica TaxID=43265 RepID=A0A545VG07_9HYPO|nr:hypothetical protein IF1G_00584 [Cordyceps javanica]